MKVIDLNEYRKPRVGEWGFCQRHGYGRIAEVSECGWWYLFDGKDTPVNKPSVKRATNREIQLWR
ncbi:hypothetical protein BrL25_05560 [Brevibacillus laterosporus DSM 25]|nr:hypothetical protein BrL25_05560 [Brevibacillus laterosporus DSM 25]